MRNNSFIPKRHTNTHTETETAFKNKFGNGVKKQTFPLRCAFISKLAFTPLVRLKWVSGKGCIYVAVFPTHSLWTTCGTAWKWARLNFLLASVRVCNLTPIQHSKLHNSASHDGYCHVIMWGPTPPVCLHSATPKTTPVKNFGCDRRSWEKRLASQLSNTNGASDIVMSSCTTWHHNIGPIMFTKYKNNLPNNPATLHCMTLDLV